MNPLLKTKFQISASLLSADFAQLGQEAMEVIAAGADMIHLDIMDNHYVPNLTMGPMICESLRKFGVTVPLDVHLMVQPVDDLIRKFIDAGANYITFHPEASLHVDRSLQIIREGGCKGGLALNPATPLAAIQEVLDKIDIVLMMSVNPGFGGQHFIPSVLEKIKRVRELLQGVDHPILLEVDGGVKIENIREIAMAGADTFVIGSAIFNTKDYRDTVEKFHTALTRVKEGLL